MKFIILLEGMIMTITTSWTINSNNNNNDDDDVWLLFLAIACHYYTNIFGNLKKKNIVQQQYKMLSELRKRAMNTKYLH